MGQDEQKKTEILKVIVGSVAHGLANENSDIDYRGVFIVPTSDLLKIGPHINQTSWIEAKVDDTSWEIGKFLFLATKCNPTILETFLSPFANEFLENFKPLPVQEEVFPHLKYGPELRALFPYVWNSDGVKNAFIGYGLNQRKKFFDNQDNRAPKYATAYLRTLYNAKELLSTGTFTVNVGESEIGPLLKRFKAGEYEIGEVIQACFDMETRVLRAYKANPNKQTNMEPINEFLLKIRKEFWE